MTKISIKLQLPNGELRRLRVHPTFDAAADTINEIFGPGLELFWTDEENDIISIKTNADFEEALRSATGTPKLSIRPATEPVTEAAAVLVDTKTEPMPKSGPEPVTAPEIKSKLGSAPDSVIEPVAAPEIDAKPEPIPESVPEAAATPECRPKPELATTALPKSERFTDTGDGIHHGVICDRSGMHPIVGMRWHMVGVDYDLCDAEFQQLPEGAKASFEAIPYPGAHPVPYEIDAAESEHSEPLYTAKPPTDEPHETGSDRGVDDGVIAFELPGFGEATFDPAALGGVFREVAEQVQARLGSMQPLRNRENKHGKKHGGWCKKGKHGHGKKHGFDCKKGKRKCRYGGGMHGQPHRWNQWRKQALVGLGAEMVPTGPVGPGDYGPGVAQLQIALIKIGALDEDAISWKQGWFGPRTCTAIAELQARYKLGGESGVFDDAVAEVVNAKLAGTFIEPEPEPEPEPEARWAEQIEKLAAMGFLNTELLVPMLDRHHGELMPVLTELLGQ